MRLLRRKRSGSLGGPLLDTARARQLAQQARERARGAQRDVVVILPLLAAVLAAYAYRVELFGMDRPVRIAAVVALVVLGWLFASALGRALGPLLFRRLDPGTAGTVGFLIRLFTIAVAVLVALRVAGLRPGTLATGGAVTAVLFGLAAQQTLGNLFAGTVLLSSQPFRLGDEIRLQSGSLGDNVEGKVVTLGLLYTTLARGRGMILVPNSTVLDSAIIPLREPTPMDVRARLRPGVKPSELQSLLDELSTPVRADPTIGLEAVDRDQTVVRIRATPTSESDGSRLADEILTRLADVTADGGDGATPDPDDGSPASGAAARSES
jgi:small-conductance mechanosensitive channel